MPQYWAIYWERFGLRQWYIRRRMKTTSLGEEWASSPWAITRWKSRTTRLTPSPSLTRLEFQDWRVRLLHCLCGRGTRKKICGLMKGDNGSCNKYKTHVDREKGHVESAFYLIMNDTNLFLKPLVSLIIEDANQAFLSQVGEDLFKDTAMAIME